MEDGGHDREPESLKELRSLSAETRRHMIGLFERHTEGLIILVVQIVAVLVLVTRSSEGMAERPLLFGVATVYILFSVFWAVRSVNAISREIYASFTRDELKSARVYDRYCGAGWFLRTVGGLLLATILALAAWNW